MKVITRWMAKLSTWWKRSRIGFSRFYGQRVVDFVRALVGRKDSRTPLQKTVLLVATLLIIGAGVYGWTWWTLIPPSTAVEQFARDSRTGATSPPAFVPSAGEESGTDLTLSAEANGENEPAEVASAGRTGSLSSEEGASALLDRSVAQAVLESAEERSKTLESETSRAPAGLRPEPSLPAVSITSMVLPVTGELARPFGWYRHPVFGDWRHSSSVVFQPEDDGDVRAALAGRVRDVVYEGGIWRVSIEHAGGWRTEYEGLIDVAVGSYELVETGQVIGRTDPAVGLGVGFSVRQGEVAINPLNLIEDGALPALAK